MKTKTEQMLYLLLAFLFAGAFMYFVKSSMISTAVAGAFVFIAGAFLGVDLARMVKRTGEMPKGQFEKADKWKYLLTMIMFGVLTGEAFAISKLFERDMAGVYASVGVGLMVVFGLLISGIEANKVKTDEGPDS